MKLLPRIKLTFWKIFNKKKYFLYAVEKQLVKIVDDSLKNDNDSINYTDQNGLTALMKTCINGNVDILWLLLKKNPNFLTNKNGNSTLELAATNGHIEIVKILFWKGFNKKNKWKEVYEALKVAILNNHIEIVKFLVDTQSILFYKDCDFDILKSYAQRFKEISTFLEENQDSINFKINNSNDLFCCLYQSIFRQDLKLVKKLINYDNFDINHTDENGNTALMMACKKGNLEIIKFLISKGAYVHHINKAGSSPLAEAILNNHPTVVNFLKLEHNAGIKLEYLQQLKIADDGYNNLTNWEKMNLREQIEEGNLEIIKFLVYNGKDINCQYEDGLTPLLVAVKARHKDMVKFLVKHDANINHVDNFDNSALTWAVLNKDFKMVEFLVEHGANINHFNKNYNSALTLTLKENYVKNYNSDLTLNLKENFKMVKFLVEHGANTNHVDKNYNSALTWAILNKDFKMVEFLVQHGAYIHPQNNNYNVLINKVKKNNKKIVQLLEKNQDSILPALIDVNKINSWKKNNLAMSSKSALVIK